MLIEAFSRVLQHPAAHEQMPTTILLDWLKAILSDEDYPSLESMRDDGLTAAQLGTIIKEAFELHITPQGQPLIVTRSRNAEILLGSLTEYAHSYDHWQYTRWLHQLKANDFNG